jgi:hypothetical protein
VLVRTWLVLAAHYGEYILHPVKLPLLLSWITNSICGSFDGSKNKASVTPFHNVVLRTEGSTLLEELLSHVGRNALAKILNIFETKK